jgi:hypothetical protein
VGLQEQCSHLTTRARRKDSLRLRREKRKKLEVLKKSGGDGSVTNRDAGRKEKEETDVVGDSGDENGSGVRNAGRGKKDEPGGRPGHGEDRTGRDRKK